MKRTAASLIFAALLIGAGASAYERVYKPHSKVNDPVLVMQLRQEMSHLESGFIAIEEHYTAEGVDYDRIKKTVDQMEATHRTIRRIVPQENWSPPLGDLASRLQKVRRAASRQDPAALRKAVDGMYDSCFRCHTANAPRYD